MTRTWDPIGPGTPILATDVAGLRNAIDEDLAAAGLSPQPWTWPNVGAGAPILAKYYAELHAAIQRLWDFKGRGPLPLWMSGVAPGGPSLGTAATPIRASDLTDLRTWLNQYEANHPPNQQGVDSLSYDPRSPNTPRIQDDWPQDILALSTQKPLYVRCNVTAPNNPITIQPSDLTIPPADLEAYRASFSRYIDANLRVYALLGLELYRTDDSFSDFKMDLQTDFANDFIRNFSDKAKSTYEDFRTVGVEDYIIFNEPNVHGIPAANFAALVYHCYQKMHQVGFPRIYWGGVFVLPTDGTPRPEDTGYVSDIYQGLVNAQKAGPGIADWPWKGINIHVQRDRSVEHVSSLFSIINGFRADRGDAGERIIGEWGITNEDYDGDPAKLSHIYSLLKPYPDVMFFLSHHYHFEASPDSSWGLRDWHPTLGQYHLDGKLQLYDPFNALMGT